MVSMRDIRAFAGRVATACEPRRIILFGSYAYGEPTDDSDVDLMVVIPHRGDPMRKAVDIRRRVDAPFSLDLLVYSPRELAHRYKIEDWFVRDVVEKGIVLYEAGDHRVDRKG